jgi:mono/diheme cytochrome c family protein
MLKFTRLILIVLASWMAFSAPLMAEPTDAEGKELFRNLCASCHNRNMKDKLTGPALGTTAANWADYPRQDLYDWIRNSQAMIASGHPRATQLWSEWKPTVMTAFPNLTDEQIESILLYINNVYTGAGKAPAGDAAPVTQVEAPKPNNTLYYILFGVLVLLAAFLANIVYNLNYMARRQAGEDLPPRKTVWQVLTSKGVVAFVVFALVVLGGYTTVNNAIALGRQQGYAPEQPIKFSHATHAGLHKIDCQYCHDGARRSKHSIIPAANTCMNCHKAIKVGSQHGTAEISKIFASIGFDPSQDKYIENYESMSEEEIAKIYKKWIGDSYVAENGSLDARGEAMIEQQWEGIKTSLTNEVKKTIPGPIEWVRIHNLPDHAYFNHAQHVTVGKVECQTCHGKVEEMEVVKQYSPLSMGWCINCHRQTEVKFGDNEYYKNYQKYHDEIKSGKRSKVTVEEIGGLECQKCHY